LPLIRHNTIIRAPHGPKSSQFESCLGNPGTVPACVASEQMVR
jgi:hypothetical protein